MGVTKRRGFVAGAAIGLFVVPAVALASMLLVEPGSSGVEQGTEDLRMAAAAAPVVGLDEGNARFAGDPVADLALACGEDGAALAARAAAGPVTDIERAALEALRPICEEAGLSLPGAQPSPGTVAAAHGSTPRYDDESSDDDRSSDHSSDGDS